MAKKEQSIELIPIASRADLRKNMRAISTRLNDNPELARLILVNPILAFEDAGVQMTSEVKQHIMDTLRFPKRLMERKAQLETEIGDALGCLDMNVKLPLNEQQRADLVFRILKVRPLAGEPQEFERISSKRARLYRKSHPLLDKLAEYERLRQGGLVFQSRETYDKYKAGLRRHHWVKSVRFKV